MTVTVCRGGAGACCPAMLGLEVLLLLCESDELLILLIIEGYLLRDGTEVQADRRHNKIIIILLCSWRFLSSSIAKFDRPYSQPMMMRW